MSDPKMTLTKISAEYCAPCRAMDQARILERFTENHPNVGVKKLNIADKEGNTIKAADKEARLMVKKALKALDGFESEAIPLLIFTDGSSGAILSGAAGGHTMKDLEMLYADALHGWHEMQEDDELPDVDDEEEAEDEEDDDGED